MNGAEAPDAVDGVPGLAAGPVRDGRLVALTLDCRRVPRDGGADVIEIAMQRIRFDPAGASSDVGRLWRWREGPDVEPRRRVGERPDGMSCRAMVDAEASSMLLDVDFVVSIRADAVRPVVETLLPLGAGRTWICAAALAFETAGTAVDVAAEASATIGTAAGTTGRLGALTAALLRVHDDGRTTLARLLTASGPIVP